MRSSYSSSTGRDPFNEDPHELRQPTIASQASMYSLGTPSDTSRHPSHHSESGYSTHPDSSTPAQAHRSHRSTSSTVHSPRHHNRRHPAIPSPLQNITYGEDAPGSYTTPAPASMIVERYEVSYQATQWSIPTGQYAQSYPGQQDNTFYASSGDRRRRDGSY